MQQPPQNPYSQQVPPTGQPQGNAPQGGYGPPVAQKRPIDKGILRQLMFGAVVVVGFELVTGILGMLANAVFSFYVGQFIYFIISVVAAAVFAGVVAMSALYISPLANARSTVELLKKIAIGGAIALVALFIINLIWAVIDGGSYLGQAIFSTAIIGSIISALTFTALFALGVLVARSVPPRPQNAAPQFGAQQGYTPQQGQAPQPHQYPQASQQQYPQQHAPQQGQPQHPGAAQAQPPYPPRP